MTKMNETAPVKLPVAECCANSGQSAPSSFMASNRALKLAGLAAPLLGIGLYAGWPWITAIGAAPLILAMVPCAVMCAIGMCNRPNAKQQSSTNIKAADGS